MNIRHFHVHPSIPPALAPLRELAMNLWYSWNWEAAGLFGRLNAQLWEESGQNPVQMLGSLSLADLEAAVRDESFVANLDRVYQEFRRYMNSPGWFSEAHPDKRDFCCAYFSCEFGLDVGLPIYSGGLGVLSGDHLKTASDLGLPLVGVGLLYQKGYFRQVLNLDGWQQELYPDNDWYRMPVHPEHWPDGRPLVVEISMAGEPVRSRIWRVQVGRTPLYLLDSNVPENSPRMREITSTLYGGDRDMRIRQEILLGIGGVRALRALGLKPTVYHMNEGHSAFLALERIRSLIAEKGISFAAAREYVAATNVFTTHTPVPAGNETFDAELVRTYLEPLCQELGLPWHELAGLGQVVPGLSRDFGMTVLALRLAAFANGVSKLHRVESRRMWQGLWPGLPVDEVPIRSITNGIHTRTWLSRDMSDLLLRYVGPRLLEDPGDRTAWERVRSIPDSELWHVLGLQKERLVFFVRRRLSAQLRRQGAHAASIRAAEEVLDPDALTIGFARRVATYKRAGLLFLDPERLARLLTDPGRPVQIVFAGKAHPQDLPAKELIKTVVHHTQDPRLRHRLVFLEDYDMNVARHLVQGVDVWLNTPRRPLEASGTSGMKAAANGSLNLSILDGWWCEGYSAETGWAIGTGEVTGDPEERDRVDSEALFNLLENDVIPLYYERDRGGMPREWMRMVKASIGRLGAQFNTHRMVREYLDDAYLPAHNAGARLSERDLAGARDLAAWRERVRAAWPRVAIRVSEWGDTRDAVVGGTVPIRIRASIGPLSPDDVTVEILHGPIDTQGEIRDGAVVRASLIGQEGEDAVFEASVPCATSGRYGFAARILPTHPDLLNPLTPLMLTWE